MTENQYKSELLIICNLILFSCKLWIQLVSKPPPPSDAVLSFLFKHNLFGVVLYVWM